MATRKILDRGSGEQRQRISSGPARLRILLALRILLDVRQCRLVIAADKTSLGHRCDLV